MEIKQHLLLYPSADSPFTFKGNFGNLIQFNVLLHLKLLNRLDHHVRKLAARPCRLKIQIVSNYESKG